MNALQKSESHPEALGDLRYFLDQESRNSNAYKLGSRIVFDKHPEKSVRWGCFSFLFFAVFFFSFLTFISDLKHC